MDVHLVINKDCTGQTLDRIKIVYRVSHFRSHKSPRFPFCRQAFSIHGLGYREIPSRKTVPPTSNAEVSLTSSGKSHGGYGGTLQLDDGGVAFFKRKVAFTELQELVALMPLALLLLNKLEVDAGAAVPLLPDDGKSSNIVLASSTATPGGELRTHNCKS
eukprot:COSAG02_NODE_9197_length_2292_cov_1.609211_1_plen_160_part_00